MQKQQSVADTSTAFKMPEQIHYILGIFRVWHNVFFCIEHKPTRKRTGNKSFIFKLICKHVFNSVTVTVTFVLRNRQANINVQTSVGCSGVVVFRHGFPLHTVGIQNFLNFMIITDVTKPSIKLRENN